MSTPILPAVSYARRTCTVVRAKRARIRRLAAGTGFVERDGYTLRINHEGPEAAGVSVGALERALSAFHLKLAGWRREPETSQIEVAHSSAALSGSLRNAGHVLRTVAHLVPRAIAIAVIALLALTGVTRFVHVDLRAIVGSVHFGIPHFLTPWRQEDDSPSTTDAPNSARAGARVTIGMQAAQYPSAIAVNGPAAPGAQQDASGQGASEGGAAGTYVPQYYRRGEGSYLPLPSDGPLPAGMSTYPRASTQVPGAVALTVHEPFTEPEDAPTDEVALMRSPTSDTPSAPEVQLLGSTTDVKAAPKGEPKQEARSDRKSEVRTERGAKEKGPVKLEVHSSGERKETARPSEQAHLANALSQSQMAVAPVVVPAQTQTPARQSASSDLVLLRQPAAQTAPVDDDGQDEDAIPLPVHQAARRQADEQMQPSGPRHPSFKVVTHTDDSIVVNEDGHMKQIPVGQTLPDGSKLLGVSHDGGGFTTNRGDYTAY